MRTPRVRPQVRDPGVGYLYVAFACCTLFFPAAPMAAADEDAGAAAIKTALDVLVSEQDQGARALIAFGVKLLLDLRAAKRRRLDLGDAEQQQQLTVQLAEERARRQCVEEEYEALKTAHETLESSAATVYDAYIGAMANGGRDALDAAEERGRQRGVTQRDQELQHRFKQREIGMQHELQRQIDHLTNEQQRLRNERDRLRNLCEHANSKLSNAKAAAKDVGAGFRHAALGAALEASERTYVADCPGLQRLIKTAKEARQTEHDAVASLGEKIRNDCRGLLFEDIPLRLSEIGLHARSTDDVSDINNSPNEPPTKEA